MLIFNFNILVLIAVFAGFNTATVQAQTPLIAPAPKAATLQTDTLTIAKQNGEKIQLNIELAVTPPQQAKGMMFRTEMADDFGMLFVFANEAPRSFWMKNTLIPLDMLFIKRNGEILNIHQNAIPHDLTPVKSNGNAYAVLEIKGGMSAKLGLNPGDKLNHAVFGMMLRK